VNRKRWNRLRGDGVVISVREAMLVGDSIHRDIVPAKALGMLALHAVYADRNLHEGEKDEADYAISDIREEIW